MSDCVGAALVPVLASAHSYDTRSEQGACRAVGAVADADARAAPAEPLTPDPNCGPLANLTGPGCSAASTTCSLSQLAMRCRPSTDKGMRTVAQQRRAVHPPQQGLRELLAPQLLPAAGTGPSGSTIRTISSGHDSLGALAVSASARRGSLHMPSDVSHTSASWAPGEAGGARSGVAKALALANCPGGGAGSGAVRMSASAASVPWVPVQAPSRMNSSVCGSTGPAPQHLRVLGPTLHLPSPSPATDGPPAEAMVARWMAGQTPATPAPVSSRHVGARAHEASDLQPWAAAASGAQPWVPGSTAEISRSGSGERATKAGWTPAMVHSTECSATSTIPSWLVAASTARPRMPRGGQLDSTSPLPAGMQTDGPRKLQARQQAYPAGGAAADAAAAARGRVQVGDQTVDDSDPGAYMTTVTAAGWVTAGAGPGPPPAPTPPSASTPSALLAVPPRYNRAGVRPLAHASRHMSQVGNGGYQCFDKLRRKGGGTLADGVFWAA